jgi:Flp pilus assembly protein TadD
VGTIFSREGIVEMQRAGKAEWISVEGDQSFEANDSLRTGASSRVAILMTDGVMVRLNQNSRFVFASSARMEVAAGEAHFLSRKPRELPTIVTPLVTASVRGTEFTVLSSNAETRIRVLQGSIQAENSFGSVALGSGDEGLVTPGAAPSRALLSDPIGSVQWAILYPATVTVEDLPDGERYLSQLEQLQGGEIELLRSSIGRSSSPSLLLVFAAAELRRGQVNEARALHQRLEQTITSASSHDGAAYRRTLDAQRAVILISQGKVAEAGALLQAHEAALDSPALALARSYLLQANFDLDSALSAMSAAVKRYPSDPILRSRLAELLLSTGANNDALYHVDEVLRETTSVARVWYLKGFAEIAVQNFAAARESFERAQVLEPGAGIPLLGLGLVSVREGDLEAGRLAIQKAALLEPTVALYRSYLGKVLFEQGEEDLARQEFEFAIDLDPEDPTPYLYRSYEKLSQHDPIGALADVEESIARNDSRAVYRSRLLLDQDSGVRSASLAKVYERLGFSELATVEALKALSRDYTNYSAHLQLGESYGDQQSLVQASISETLVARLLSPVNFNLIRPSQGGSAGAGEYTSLFDRNQQRVELSAGYDSYLEERRAGALFSGTSGSWGYALQHESRSFDGYRDNDDLEQHLSYGSLQYQAARDTTLLLDLRTEFYEEGDIGASFQPQANDPDSSLELDDVVARFGFNHRLSQGTHLIGQFVYTNADILVRDQDAPRVAILSFVPSEEELVLFGLADQRVSFKTSGARFDTQFISQGETFSHVLGASGLDSQIATKERGQSVFSDFDLDIDLQSRSDNTEGSLRGYYYGTFHAAPWADLQFGVSLSRLHLAGAPLSVPTLEDTETLRDISPKLGFVITPLESTTIRGAFYEAIGSSGIRELETIEPTLLGGFNQSIFDFFPGTRARELTLGIDHRFKRGLYGGIQGARRHIVQRFPQSFDLLSFDEELGELSEPGRIPGINPDTHFDLNLYRGYLYAVLSDRISATVDGTFEEDRDTLDDLTVDTGTVSLGLNYFHPSGWYGFVRGNWRHQERDGYGSEEGDITDGTEQFWTVDSGVGYRFAKRRGSIELVGTNLFDESYEYVPRDRERDFYPGASIGIRCTYTFEP